MSERKFARGLGKPGTAAQLRETVSQVVRESTVQVSVETTLENGLVSQKSMHTHVFYYLHTFEADASHFGEFVMLIEYVLFLLCNYF